VAKDKVDVIPISSIRENPVALRTVNRESESFIGLRDSIAAVGLLNPISVRARDEVDNDGNITVAYELVDGLHRYTGCRDAGLTEIPVIVKSLDDAQTLEAQIMANVHKVETHPVEYTKQLQRIFAGNPTLTLADMAAKIAKSPAWISQRLNLLKLEATIQALVDDGKITVSNAVQLAKLPPEEQVNYVDQAMVMGSEEFVPLVQARAKDLRDAARQGRKAEPSVYVASPKCQKMAALIEELNSSTIGPQLCKKCEVTNAADGFALGVAWALNVDPISVEVRTAKDTERKVALSDEKKKRAADRASKKAAEAAKVAAAAAEAAGV